MAVCKFFLDGYCRYGTRCKFKHPYDDGRDRYYDNGNNYYNYEDHNYNRNQPRHTNSQAFSGVSILRTDRSNNPSFTPIQNQSSSYQSSNYNAPSGFSGYSSTNYNVNNSNTQQSNTPTSQLVQDLLTAILKELDTSENGHQWPLSCCCPVIRETVNIPGWVDHSPEELRWELYKASKDGTFEQCKASTQLLFREAQDKRNEFKSREKAIPLIETMLEMKQLGSSTFSSTEANSAFPAQNSFVGSNNIPPPLTAFAATPAPAQTQPFTSNFGSAPAVPTAVPAGSARLFQDPAPTFSFALNANPVQNNINNSIPTPAPSLPPQMFNNQQFIQQQNLMPFNGTSASTGSSSENNSSNFSNLSELTESELNAFQAGRFRFGHVPMKPPPNELC